MARGVTGRKVARPAQGNNAIGFGGPPARRPAPAYSRDIPPHVVGTGTLSHPKPPGDAFKGKRQVPDTAPKVVHL